MPVIYFVGKREKIIEAIRQAVYETGEAAFTECQATVPVDTGALRASGFTTRLLEGITLRYTVDYASIVERGWEGGRVWTAPHIRRGGIKVKGHYKNQPPRLGTHFIETSLKKFFVDNAGQRTIFQGNVITALHSQFPGSEIKEI